jgi:hypothetical protein
VCPRAPAEPFWSALRERDDAPPALVALSAGRTRVEVTRSEAVAALDWAAGVDGWATIEPKPLFVYEPGG